MDLSSKKRRASTSRNQKRINAHDIRPAQPVCNVGYSLGFRLCLQSYKCSLSRRCSAALLFFGKAQNGSAFTTMGQRLLSKNIELSARLKSKPIFCSSVEWRTIHSQIEAFEDTW